MRWRRISWAEAERTQSPKIGEVRLMVQGHLETHGHRVAAVIAEPCWSEQILKLQSEISNWGFTSDQNSTGSQVWKGIQDVKPPIELWVLLACLIWQWIEAERQRPSSWMWELGGFHSTDATSAASGTTLGNEGKFWKDNNQLCTC